MLPKELDILKRALAGKQFYTFSGMITSARNSSRWMHLLSGSVQPKVPRMFSRQSAKPRLAGNPLHHIRSDELHGRVVSASPLPPEFIYDTNATQKRVSSLVVNGFIRTGRRYVRICAEI